MHWLQTEDGQCRVHTSCYFFSQICNLCRSFLHIMYEHISGPKRLLNIKGTCNAPVFVFILLCRALFAKLIGHKSGKYETGKKIVDYQHHGIFVSSLYGKESGITEASSGFLEIAAGFYCRARKSAKSSSLKLLVILRYITVHTPAVMSNNPS